MDALFFGAHPDDVELTSGGLAARLAAHGHPVLVVDLTRRAIAASPGLAVEPSGEVRVHDGRAETDHTVTYMLPQGWTIVAL